MFSDGNLGLELERHVDLDLRDLTTKIRQFINGWNDRKHPFIWTKTPEEILAKINRKKTSTPGH